MEDGYLFRLTEKEMDAFVDSSSKQAIMTETASEVTP